MKAVQIYEYGDENVLRYEDVPEPIMKEDDLLVEVFAAGLNPVDWKVREGYLQEILPHQLPLILGWDVSGVVKALGKNVKGFKIGDFVYSRPDISRNGSYAQYIVVRSSEVAHKPKSITHNQSACIPLAALTAWQALFDLAKLSKGQRILIHAAAGGVGSFAVQFAKIQGAYVIATGSAIRKEYLTELGVDQFIDYTSVNFEDNLNNVDVVLDTIGGDTLERSWQVLRSNGHLVSIVETPAKDKAAAVKAKSDFLFVQPNAEQLTKIAKLVDEDKIKIHIEKIFSLEQAKQAQQLSQSGRVQGKIILQIKV